MEQLAILRNRGTGSGEGRADRRRTAKRRRPTLCQHRKAKGTLVTWIAVECGTCAIGSALPSEKRKTKRAPPAAVSFDSGHDSPVQLLLVRAIQGNGKRFPRTAFCHPESTNSN